MFELLPALMWTNPLLFLVKRLSPLWSPKTVSYWSLTANYLTMQLEIITLSRSKET